MISIFNYEEYIKFMNAKKKRDTDSLFDYISDKEIYEYKLNQNKNLSKFDPTPQNIKNHIVFTTKVFAELFVNNSEDSFLQNLSRPENIRTIVSTNWYEDYGYKY